MQHINIEIAFGYGNIYFIDNTAHKQPDITEANPKITIFNNTNTFNYVTLLSST